MPEPVFVADLTHTRAAARVPAYRALTTEANILDAVLEDIENARDLDEARRIIGQKKNSLWRRSREILADEARAAAGVPGWNGAGSNVNGIDYEVGRG